MFAIYDEFGILCTFTSLDAALAARKLFCSGSSLDKVHRLIFIKEIPLSASSTGTDPQHQEVL